MEDQEELKEGEIRPLNVGQPENMLDECKIKFLASFFNIIFEIKPERLIPIAARFQLPQYGSIYKYSSAIFQKILKLSGLSKIITDYSVFLMN